MNSAYLDYKREDIEVVNAFDLGIAFSYQTHLVALN